MGAESIGQWFGGLNRTLLAWSSGKDSAWALHILRQQGVGVSGLLTTVHDDRVPIHDVPISVVDAQAEEAGLPLWKVSLPRPCSNNDYESSMANACRRAVAEGFDTIAFGDLFLADIRAYRERHLTGTGLTPIFPLWQMPTDRLARQMISGGLKARLVSVDPRVLDARFVGREFDLELLADLPPSVDPCGENGEFHTMVYDGPMFRTPIPADAA